MTVQDAERAITELSIRLHWIAGHVADAAIAHRLRDIADDLAETALSLRALVATGFGDLD